MTLTTNLLLFMGAAIILAASAYALTRSLSRIAAFLHMSEFVAAFVIIAFSTSIPELFVGITSALEGNPALSLGTVIGSNIADLTLVLGIAVVLARGIAVKKRSIQKDSVWMLFIAALPMVLMVAGRQLSRIDGAILMAVFIAYVVKQLKQRKHFHATLENRVNRWAVIGYVLLFVASLAVLFFSADFVVKYGSALAVDLLLPSILIGIFLIALATSLPELAFETASVKTGHPEFALGDSIGSVVANSTIVLGITALIAPITANFFLFLTSALFMIIICLIFVTFIYSGNRLDWKEGVSMIALYVFFVIIELTIRGYFGNAA